MQTDYRQIFADGIWRQNTGLVVLLGLCPLLAVTNTVVNGLGLGLATILTLVFFQPGGFAGPWSFATGNPDSCLRPDHCVGGHCDPAPDAGLAV